MSYISPSFSNEQTGDIYLAYSKTFFEMCENETFDNPDQLAGSLEAIVRKHELEGLKYFGFMQPGYLALKLVEDYLYDVDWMEIVAGLSKHFQQIRAEAAAA